MKLLNTYENIEEAESALSKINGQSRLASERDATETVYNLFGEATWSNLYNLGMFNLPTLKVILEKRQNGGVYDESKHKEILSYLRYAESSFDLKIPKHWF